MLTFITITVARLVGALSRRLHRGGGDSLPGMLTGWFDPRLSTRLAGQLPHGIILVTGTNGKTTTTKLLADMLAAAGEHVVTNSSGSNLEQGIVSALIARSDRRGNLTGGATVGLFEVDEAAFPSVTNLIGADHIIVTNLFRDQLDRYGEVDTTASMIGRGIAGTCARLHLNSDDPMVTSLRRHAPSGHVGYFGLQQGPASAGSGYQTVVDSDRCPLCDGPLIFDKVFYSHLGHYRCSEGHFARPHPEVAVTEVARVDADCSRFAITIGEQHYTAQLPLGGLYNVYNAMAAVSAATGFGVPVVSAITALNSATPAFGRQERFTWRNRTVQLILVKNPAGFTQVLDTFLLERQEAQILIAINDLAADGRDVSWLWDVPFEYLTARNPHVVVTGGRGADMALRLHYADIAATVENDTRAALITLVERLAEGQTGLVLATYTAMLQLREQLAVLSRSAPAA